MPLGTIWVYLESTPLLGLTATLVGWQVAVALSRALGDQPLANPVLIAILLLSLLLLSS